jgi:ABC-2 type transport system permease protein
MIRKRLLLIEIEKLVRSSVFFVAPIVLVFFLGLMLFGYEVYAAKKGVIVTDTAERERLINEEEMTGSVVVSISMAVKRIGINTFRLIVSPFLQTEGGARIEADLKEAIGEVVEPDKIFVELDLKLKDDRVQDFNYFSRFIDSLIHPKPLPKPGCDCEEIPGSKKDDRKGSVLDLFIGTAHAAQFKKPPPLIQSTDSFIGRVQKRLSWLVESTDLEHSLIDRKRLNGIRFAYLSFYFAYVFIFPLICISVAAQLFAGEFANATITSSLLRPVRRSELLATKLAVIYGYLVVLLLMFTVVTIFVGVMFSGYGNLSLDSEVLGNIAQDRIILADGAVMLLLTAPVFASIGLLPLVAFAVLISYIKPEPATVTGISSIVYFILLTLGDLPLFEDINFLFFTTYMDTWTLMFVSPFASATFLYKLTISLLMAAGLAALIAYISNKKDIYV